MHDRGDYREVIVATGRSERAARKSETGQAPRRLNERSFNTPAIFAISIPSYRGSESQRTF